MSAKLQTRGSRLFRPLAAAAVLMVGVSSPAATLADLPCPSFTPFCGFSVSGKKGPFIKQIDQAKLDALAADAAKTSQISANQDKAKGLSNSSINRSDLSGDGLYMPHTQARFDAMVASLRAHWPYRDPGPVTIHIIGSTAFAPSAKPDNSIVVPLGLLIRSTTDDEVAWVLAHEYSHLALGHFARTAELEARKRSIDHVVNLLLMGLTLSQERVQNTGQGVHLYAVSDPSVAQHANAAESRAESVRTLLSLRSQMVSRDQEDQADADGVDLAMAAGYAADDGSAQALDTIADDDAKMGGLFESLTAEVKRSSVQSFTEKGATALQSGEMGGAATDFLGHLKANLATVAGQKLLEALSNSHRPTAARRKGLSAYLSAAYPNAPDLSDKTTWLTTVRSDPEYRAAKIAVDAHDQSAIDLETGDAKKALADLDPARQTGFGRSAFIDDQAALAEAALGDFNAADRLYDEAEANGARTAPARGGASAPGPGRGSHGRRHAAATDAASQEPSPRAADAYLQQSLTGFEGHVHLLAAHGAYDKARLKIAQAEKQFGDHQAFLPDLIFMDLKQGRTAELTAAVDECRETEDEGLVEQCRIAWLDDDQKKQREALAPSDRARFDKALTRQSNGVGRLNMFQGLTSAEAKPQ
jgi:Zn-dependent protease with chaperone function